MNCFLTIILLQIFSHNVFASSFNIATTDWPPYSNENSKEKGFTYEIIQESFKAQNHSVNIQFLPWSRLLKMLEKGKIDAAFPAYYSKERDIKYSYSNDFFDTKLYIWKRKNERVKYHSLSDLYPYEIGVVRGYVNSVAFDSDSNLKKIPVSSDKQNIFKIINNRIKLIVIDEINALEILSRNFPKKKDSIEKLGEAIDIKPLYLIAPKNKQHCVDIFNKGLDIIIKNGKLKSILNRYGV